MELGLINFSRLGSRAMDNLREEIHENEHLNQIAYHVRSYMVNFFLSQERHLQTFVNSGSSV
jgi:hypothetical protein